MPSRLIQLTAKLRGRGRAELWDRAKQALSASAERWEPLAPLDVGDPERHMARRLTRDAAGRSDGAALAAMLRDHVRGMLPSAAHLGATVDALRVHAPHDEASVLARAERVLAGRFDLLGFRDLSFGAPVDWHLDPVHDRRAPRLHWHRVPYLDLDAVGDHKIVWELNRHQVLLPLAQAFAYAGEARYAEGARRLLVAWMDANPPKQGINWASSLEIAFRTMSWIWVIGLCLDAPAFDDALLARLLAFADVHGRHLERHLSTWFAPNTHLSGEALGLLYLGRAFPMLARAERWRTMGDAILEQQCAIHLRADGTYFEQTSQYHRYATEIFVHWLLLSPGADDGARAARRAAVGRAMEFLMQLTRPDGTMPLFGDDDGGRIVPLDAAEPHDVRSVLGLGALLLERTDLAYVGHRDYGLALWLLGPGAASRIDALGSAPPTERSRAFPDGGYYVMRDGWGPRASHAVIDCGPHGVLNGTHAHADALSLTLTLQGREVLVDPGTYTYPGAERNAYRAPAAHNVLLVDGRGAAAPSEAPFRWDATADGVARTWAVFGDHDVFTGALVGTGALDLLEPPERTVVRIDGGPWLVADRARAGTIREFETRWHLAPDLRATVVHPSVIVVHDATHAPVCVLVGANRDGAWSLEAGSVSPQYGVRLPATVCSFRQRGRDACELRAVFLPMSIDAPAWRCRVWVDDLLVADLAARVGSVPDGAADGALDGAGVGQLNVALLVRDPNAPQAGHAPGGDGVTRSGYDTDADVVHLVARADDGTVDVRALGGTFVTLPDGERLERLPGAPGMAWTARRVARGAPAVPGHG